MESYQQNPLEQVTGQQNGVLLGARQATEMAAAMQEDQGQASKAAQGSPVRSSPL